MKKNYMSPLMRVEKVVLSTMIAVSNLSNPGSDQAIKPTTEPNPGELRGRGRYNWSTGDSDDTGIDDSWLLEW